MWTTQRVAVRVVYGLWRLYCEVWCKVTMMMMKILASFTANHSYSSANANISSWLALQTVGPSIQLGYLVSDIRLISNSSSMSITIDYLWICFLFCHLAIVGAQDLIVLSTWRDTSNFILFTTGSHFWNYLNIKAYSIDTKSTWKKTNSAVKVLWFSPLLLLFFFFFFCFK